MTATKGNSGRLAIDGGTKAVSEEARKAIKPWPPVYPETAERLKAVYLSRQWSFNGPCEQEFSRKFAAYCGVKHGVFMANGTVTLESALHALGVKAGDEVIVPGNTWVATAMAAVYLGATPVFVDVEPHTLCLDPENVRKAITPKTKAIIPVHLFGSMADLDRIMALSRESGIPVIEDCAHAHGGVWHGKGVGGIGHVGSFSFQQSKTLASGESGICVTNDDELAEKLFRIKHIGYSGGQKQGQAATSPAGGLLCHNYRGLEFPAAILTGALKHLRAQTTLRDSNARYFTDLIRDVPGIAVQARGRKADVQGYYGFVLLLQPSKLKSGVTIKEVHAALKAEGLDCGIGGYGPVYKHMLWNVPRTGYRIHSTAVVEDTSSNRMLGFSHAVLLTNKSLMKAHADGVRKVMNAYCR
jgi:L-glutamine:2-deoxy-scyllo-inosose/3-amino-2,3-dideoxy-scyllo-inosose aminotransferase